MPVTMEQIEIIDQAELLGKMIVESELAEEYRRCLIKMKSDPSSRRKIDRFRQWKDRYAEVQRFGRYHPDYQKVMTEVRAAKREMDLDENVANFKRAENQLQMLLDEISVMIGKAVSDSVKISTGSPFFETAAKKGCSTGGACGCQ
jgi:Protein of unknown function (DUF964).